MRAAVALLLVTVALAGCTVEPPQVQGEIPRPARQLPGIAQVAGGAGNLTGNATEGILEPPVWTRGMWWRYQARSGDGSFNRRDTRVVTGDLGSHYIVDTDDLDTAYFEAQEDISNVGAIRKSDLAGDQGGTPIEFFRWPMAVNNTWTTPWDGVVRSITVTGVRTALYAGKQVQAFELEATEAGQLAVRYNYIVEAGWFGSIEFVPGAGDDASGFRLDLEGFGSDFRGSTVRVALAPLYRDSGQNLKPQGTFTAPSGASYLDARAEFQGDNVVVNLAFQPPTGPPFTFNLPPCTGNCSLAFNASLNATPGGWMVLSASVVQGSMRQPFAELTVAAVTVTRTAFA